MNVELMRSEISKVYSGEGWKTKVKRMPYLQVIAVYHSFLKDDRFKKKEVKPKNYGREARQITFDDVLIGWDIASGPDMTCERSYNDKGEIVSESFS